MSKNKYKNIAKQVIQNEIEGLKKLKTSIGISFEKIINRQLEKYKISISQQMALYILKL